MGILDGKVICVTGGTGSFGQKFTEIALHSHDPKVIRIFSRGEFLQSEMAKKFRDDRLRFFIGDVRDKDRLLRAIEGVDIVVHAAALKQIPTCEYNPTEAVRTNILGSLNVVDCAIDSEVRKVILISSDKACHPVNLYGATKLVAEKFFIQANSYCGDRETRFSVVRYGNVVGSRGSVIPLFFEQRGDGKLTITDPKMSRFWITLAQGVGFVIRCLGEMVGGEVFIPKLPSVNIVDLARAISLEAELEIIGARPGEKKCETLLAAEESLHCREFKDYFIVEPEHVFWSTIPQGKGRVPPQEFDYTSDNCGQRLSIEACRTLMEELEKERVGRFV